MGFSGDSDGRESSSNAGDMGSIPGLGRSPGERNGYPLQYPCLENPIDRGAWQAIIHRITESEMPDCTCRQQLHGSKQTLWRQGLGPPFWLSCVQQGPEFLRQSFCFSNKCNWVGGGTLSLRTHFHASLPQSTFLHLCHTVRKIHFLISSESFIFNFYNPIVFLQTWPQIMTVEDLKELPGS